MSTVTPVVGMGATIQGYTDRHAATIVHVGRLQVWVKRDIAVRTDNNGMSEAQEYSYTSNPHAPLEKFSLRSNGTYIAVGRKMGQGRILHVGFREKYHDFTF